jgi:selenide,water dikinase
LVGPETRDDAAVYLMTPDKAVVVTTDFFTPVVDDPFDFGRIAAANALSDLYAMGATPLFALNIVGYPARKLPMEWLGEIIRGGSSVTEEAGIPVLGGHSIDDAEPKYGLVAVGEVHPDQIWRNKGAVVGDDLILTKPLGSGVITTGIKRQLVTVETITEVTDLMVMLNKDAATALAGFGGAIHAVTDVTGFGLLGHLGEILDSSGVGVELKASRIPILSQAVELAAQGIAPGGSRANLETVGPDYSFGDDISDDLKLLLADAQTSGGLLVSVDPAKTAAVVQALQTAGTPIAAVIGRITDGPRRVVLL